MNATPDYKPCPGGGWKDHVIEVITLLKPVLTDEMDAVDRVVYIDNLYEEFCSWHIMALMFLAVGYFNGNGIIAADLLEASQALMDRSEDTIGRPHP